MAQRRNDRKQEGSSDMPRQMPSEIDRQMKEAAAGIGGPFNNEDGNRLLDYPNFEAAFNDLSGNAGQQHHRMPSQGSFMFHGRSNSGF